MQSIDDFVEGLLQEKGIVNIEPSVKEELKEEMKAQLEEQINKAAVYGLSEEKAEELANLVDDPNFTKEQMTEFIRNSGVDLDKITAEIMSKFRGFYLGTGE